MREGNGWKRLRKRGPAAAAICAFLRGCAPDPLQNPPEPSGVTLVGVRSAADHDFSRLSRFPVALR